MSQSSMVLSCEKFICVHIIEALSFNIIEKKPFYCVLLVDSENNYCIHLYSYVSLQKLILYFLLMLCYCNNLYNILASSSYFVVGYCV